MSLFCATRSSCRHAASPNGFWAAREPRSPIWSERFGRWTCRPQVGRLHSFTRLHGEIWRKSRVGSLASLMDATQVFGRSFGRAFLATGVFSHSGGKLKCTRKLCSFQLFFPSPKSRNGYELHAEVHLGTTRQRQAPDFGNWRCHFCAT